MNLCAFAPLRETKFIPSISNAQIAALGFSVQDVRDIGLRGHPDHEVMDAAIASDAIIITRDRGLADPN